MCFNICISQILHDGSFCWAASQTRTAPSRPAPSQSYSSPSRPIISSPSPFRTYETEYITSTLAAPAPTYYGAPAAGLGFGSSGAFFLVFLGCAAVQVVTGFISERSMRGSLLAGSQTSSVLKLQVFLQKLCIDGWWICLFMYLQSLMRYCPFILVVKVATRWSW